MRHGTGRVGKWVGLILASLGAAVIVGFGVKHAILYNAYVRWPGQEEIYIVYMPIDELAFVEEKTLKKVGRAARIYHAISGIIPSSQTQLVQLRLLRSDLDDPFNPRARRADYKFRVEDRVLYIWSYGPDMKNGGGTIRYDPTNGLESVGDIITVVKF